MNWGYKILIVYAVFVLGISFLVIKASAEKTDLVASDYYNKELKYQDKIDALNNVQQLSDTIKYKIDNGRFSIIFPKEFSGKKMKVEMVLYCPSDENKDIKKDFVIDNALVLAHLQDGDKGNYNLQLTWVVNETNYYFEKKIFIN